MQPGFIPVFAEFGGYIISVQLKPRAHVNKKAEKFEAIKATTNKQAIKRRPI